MTSSVNKPITLLVSISLLISSYAFIDPASFKPKTWELGGLDNPDHTYQMAPIKPETAPPTVPGYGPGTGTGTGPGTMPVDPPPEKKTVDEWNNDTVNKLFGPYTKNFLAGWKKGEKWYSRLGKCDEVKDFLNKWLNCESPSAEDCPADGSLDSDSPYCIVEVVEEADNITYKAKKCYEKNCVPDETPCVYKSSVRDSSNTTCLPKFSTADGPGPGPSPSPAHTGPQAQSPPADGPPANSHTAKPTSSGNRIIIPVTYLSFVIMLVYPPLICSLF